jgi:hypothetical protein
MSASPKDVAQGPVRVTVGEPNWLFRTTLPEAQVTAEAHRLRVIAIYRARAQECLGRARLARNDGLVAAAVGYLDEAETWARFADAWELRPSTPGATTHTIEGREPGR